MRLVLALWRFYVSDDRLQTWKDVTVVLQWFQKDSPTDSPVPMQPSISTYQPHSTPLFQRTAMDVAKFFLDGWRPPVSTWRVSFWKTGDFCPFADEQTEFSTDGTGKATAKCETSLRSFHFAAERFGNFGSSRQSLPIFVARDHNAW